MQLTDKQALKQKQSLAQKQSPQRLWLSFIITLFIFASSVSAYFLVKNSQDIRRSAAEPYSQCTCLYVSDCSVAGMKPCAGSCSPACSGPTSCCQPITSDLCTKGERYCVNNNSIAVCKPDRSGYTITSCAAGTQCDNALKACKAIPTPTATCQGTCYTNSSCTAIGKVPATGTCRLETSICCKEASPQNCAATNQSCQSKACCNSSDVCETVYGGKFCVSKGTECSSGQQKCAQEGSASYVYTCSSGGYWQKNQACDFGCNGTTCKSVCTPGAKRCSGNAIETCNASGAAWSKQSCTYGCQTVEGTSSCKAPPIPTPTTIPGSGTTTCQGTCYTNSSCTAIGKAPATGTCINETSVCCKEVEAATSGLKALGDKCNDSSECTSGNCATSYINNVGEVVFLGPNYRVCVPSLAEQDSSVVSQHQKELVYGAAAATFATTAITGATAIPSIINLAGGSLTALPTAAYVYGTTTLATAPAWVQTALSVAGVAGGWAGVGGGAYACVTNPNSPACDAFVAGMMSDPNAMMSLANATDDLITSVQLTARQNSIYSQLDKIIAEQDTMLSNTGITTIYHADRSTGRFADDPNLNGYYQWLNGEIHLLDDPFYRYRATTHEQIHAIRDTLVENNVYGFVDSMNIPKDIGVSDNQVTKALEEIWTISENLSIFDSIPGFNNTYPFSEMYTMEQSYLNRQHQKYLGFLEQIYPNNTSEGLQFLPNTIKQWLSP